MIFFVSERDSDIKDMFKRNRASRKKKIGKIDNDIIIVTPKPASASACKKSFEKSGI